MPKLTPEQKQHLKSALNRYAWPGGYPVFALLDDCEAICADCLRDNLRQIIESTRDNARDGWTVTAAFANWEDPHLYCDHCSTRLESAYAEAEAG